MRPTTAVIWNRADGLDGAQGVIHSMSAWGQKAKYSLRADVFHSTPESGLKPDIAGCPLCAAISELPVTLHCVATSVISFEPTNVLVVMKAHAATMLASVMKPIQGQALSALKSLRPQQGVDQIKQQAGSDEGCE
jgi:hypothetical protein